MESISSERKKMTHQQHQDDIDRIGELPDSLLIHILSLLDDMKDAIKTDLLSKRWKHLWTNLDTLVYNCDIKKPSKEEMERFLLFVDQTLMKCTCPNIKKFCLAGFGFNYRLSPVFSKPLVDKWLDFVIGKNVEVVKLGLQGLDYVIPVCFFQNSSFVRLEVDYVGKKCDYYNSFLSLTLLESARENTGPYRYRKPFDVSWNKLVSLSLKGVYVYKNFMSEILGGCPVLETLVLDAIRGLTLLDIKSPSVSELKVLNLEYNQVDDGINLVISAPWVEKLEISGCFSVARCNLVSVPSLKSAVLTLNYSIFFCLASYSDYDVDPRGYFKDVWFIMIDWLLRPVCSVDELVVGVELLQALSLSKILDGDSPIFISKHITIQSPICVHEVPGIVSLLESSPYMATLVIKMMPWQCHFSTYNQFGKRYTNYMEKVFASFNCIDYLSEQNGKFLRLKNVNIDCTELYSRDDEDQGSKNMCFELKVVAHIIKNSPALQKLVILSYSSDYVTQYIQLMSSEDEVGDKATGWDLKKGKAIYEFNFC